MGRSHSVSSTRSNRFDDDYRELLRAASTRSALGRSNNMDVRTRQQYITHQKPATEQMEVNLVETSLSMHGELLYFIVMWNGKMQGDSILMHTRFQGITQDARLNARG
ncbi:hypothetical protein DKX38_014871 [Salix brachista]|uniref:Uncharacterized protein n=1 Tax=Salix brachista TaxID=2182728 RepID=A0A5N5L4B5_9ROSI|nr:hypothetical protein DKX38_014871 [Salix brachista]